MVTDLSVTVVFLKKIKNILILAISWLYPRLRNIGFAIIGVRFELRNAANSTLFQVLILTIKSGILVDAYDSHDQRFDVHAKAADKR